MRLTSVKPCFSEQESDFKIDEIEAIKSKNISYEIDSHQNSDSVDNTNRSLCRG